MNAETTRLRGDRFDRLEVEFLDTHAYARQLDGKFQQVTRTTVSLVTPEGAYQKRVRIVNLDPTTALSLLEWLQQHRETLEQLAQSEP